MARILFIEAYFLEDLLTAYRIEGRLSGFLQSVRAKDLPSVEDARGKRLRRNPVSCGQLKDLQWFEAERIGHLVGINAGSHA